MPNHDIFIPSHWSGEQALAIAGMLQQIVDAIWDAHAHKMGPVLQGGHRDEMPEPVESVAGQDGYDVVCDDFDDDIPW